MSTALRPPQRDTPSPEPSALRKSPTTAASASAVCPLQRMRCRFLLPRPPPCMAQFQPAPTPLQRCQNMSDRCPLRDADEASLASDDVEPVFSLTLHLHGKPVVLPFYQDTVTLQDLSDAVADELQIPAANQKFLVTPKTGLLKPPFADPTIPLRSLAEKKIVLFGATEAEVRQLENDAAARKARADRRRAALAAARNTKVHKSRDWKKAQDEAKYTFHAIRPLSHLPAPEKSQRFLERLANDPGIKASMRSHGFAVGLLTEMDPAEHTTHNSKTLGLNRNHGQVIELRLRTDAYDGYRDYRIIRKTLCHELAHNVWGDHDRNFWNLCREIEDEVDRNDWRHGGHSLSNYEFYNPDDEGVDEEADGGGWVGGEFVLGTGPTASGQSTSSSAPPTEPLTRREIMARAAEERARHQTETKPAPSSSSQEHKPKEDEHKSSE